MLGQINDELESMTHLVDGCVSYHRSSLANVDDTAARGPRRNH
jgi:hypothetical protein